MGTDTMLLFVGSGSSRFPHDLQWLLGEGPCSSQAWMKIPLGLLLIPHLQWAIYWWVDWGFILQPSKGEYLGFPLSICWLGWEYGHVFFSPLYFSRVGRLLSEHFCLAGCFPVLFFRESWLGGFNICLFPLMFMGCWLLWHPVWDLCGKKTARELTAVAFLGFKVSLASLSSSVFHSSFACFIYNAQDF